MQVPGKGFTRQKQHQFAPGGGFRHEARTGQMQRVDQGHIDYATYSPDGTLLVDGGRIHINHQPGPGDC